MRSSIRARILMFTVLGVLLAGSGCPGCENDPPDAGVDAGTLEDGGTPPEDGGTIPAGDGGSGIDCDENTEGFGDPCAAQEGDPLCGNFICCTEGNPFCAPGQQLFCYDLGPNECGGCGDLDTMAGRVGETCGEFGCGEVQCADGGTATECVGDHPRNDCGGCEDLPPDAGPGDICSECQTGVQTCTRDMNDLVCWRGRSDDNACQSCGRCVLAHARMDERFGGGYIRTGTVALVEDIGGGVVQLVFDPLVEGPGANGLPETYVYLSDGPTLEGSTVRLQPPFSDTSDFLAPTGSDPVRSFTLSSTVNLEGYTNVILADAQLEPDGLIISVGELIAGPPDDLDGGVAPIVDAGSPGDAGATDAGGGDAGPSDGGADSDGGSPADGGVADAGPADAGLAEPSDAGSALDGGDGGPADAG